MPYELLENQKNKLRRKTEEEKQHANLSKKVLVSNKHLEGRYVFN